MAGQTCMHARVLTHTCPVRILKFPSGEPCGGWEGLETIGSMVSGHGNWNQREKWTEEQVGDSLIARLLRSQLTLANWAAIQRPQLSVRGSKKPHASPWGTCYCLSSTIIATSLWVKFLIIFTTHTSTHYWLLILPLDQTSIDLSQPMFPSYLPQVHSIMYSVSMRRKKAWLYIVLGALALPFHSGLTTTPPGGTSIEPIVLAMELRFRGQITHPE